jgi:hypothetical protein
MPQISEIIARIRRDLSGPPAGCCENATGGAFLRQPVALIAASSWIKARSMLRHDFPMTSFHT